MDKLPTMFLEPDESNKIAEMNRLEKMMEEMAGKDKAEYGKREPGEPSTYAGEIRLPTGKQGKQPSVGNELPETVREEKGIYVVKGKEGEVIASFKTIEEANNYTNYLIFGEKK